MRLRSDRSEGAVVNTAVEAWTPSPEPGVDRVMLERDGGEVARATSVVRYRPGASFEAHVHERGEEFLVVDGEFRDEHGIYPRGTYVRNPWGSVHRPSSPLGCLLFVKLRQVPTADDPAVRAHRTFERCTLDGGCAVAELLLHASPIERAAIRRIDGGHVAQYGEEEMTTELFVLEGSLLDGDGSFATGTWLRIPAHARRRMRAATETLLFVKAAAS